MHPTPLIDAHHHLWRYNSEEFGWIGEEMKSLRRDFLPIDLEKELAGAGVHGTLAIQARCTEEETAFLIQCAQQSSCIWGVVGWVPLESSSLYRSLDRFCSNPLFRGVREISQGRQKAFDGGAFNQGIRLLTERKLTYDILIYSDQLPEAIVFVDRHPQQQFILDHAAKPGIREQVMDPWAEQIGELAKRGNVVCKLSGLALEADWENWSLDSLRPYLDVCVEAFGLERLLAGSDWPVCLPATGYAHWWDVLRQYLRQFSTQKMAAVLGGNAVQTYGLTAPEIGQ